MNRYRHHLSTQTRTLLPTHLLICLAAHVAHFASKAPASPSGGLICSTNTVAAVGPSLTL